MCKWNKNKGMADEQSILILPYHIATHKQNRIVCIDKCIQHVIEHLWKHDIETLACCCGHDEPDLKGASLVITDGYDLIDIDRIRKLIKQVDKRDWTIFQWRLVDTLNLKSGK